MADINLHIINWKDKSNLHSTILFHSIPLHNTSRRPMPSSLANYYT